MSSVITTAEMIHFFRRRPRWMLIGAAVGLAAGLALSVLLPTRYEALALLRLGTIDNAPIVTKEALSYTLLSRPTMSAIADRVKADGGPAVTWRELRRWMSVEPVGDLLLLRVQAPAPESARQLCGIVCETLVGRHAEQLNQVRRAFEETLDETIKWLNTKGARMNQQDGMALVEIAKLRLTFGASNRLTAVETAPYLEKESPVFPPRRTALAGMAALTGAILGALLAAAAEAFGASQR